jgi:hypothetical protein
MKAAAFTIALLMSGAAFAQTDETTTAYEGDGSITMPYETEGNADAMTDAVGVAVTGTAVAGTSVSLPSNAAPERDARGIAVISDPAIVPAGFNGTIAGTAMGGPELDAAGQPVAPEAYPACTATVTDNCLQTYEKGRVG